MWRSQENSQFGSPTCIVRDTTVTKVKWKPLELPLPGKMMNQRKYHSLGGTAEISATHKGLKLSGADVSCHISL